MPLPTKYNQFYGSKIPFYGFIKEDIEKPGVCDNGRQWSKLEAEKQHHVICLPVRLLMLKA